MGSIKKGPPLSIKKGPPLRESRKGIIQSTHLVNSIKKFRFPSTDVHMHPENQRYQFSAEILRIKEYSNLIGWVNAQITGSACSSHWYLSISKKLKSKIKQAKRY